MKNKLPKIRPEKGILILNHYGFGNVVMSIPLMRAVCGWAKNCWPIFLLLASRRHYEIIKLEELSMEILFLEDFKPNGTLWPFRLRRELVSKIDLILAIPQIPVSRILFVKYLLGARITSGEIFKFYRPLVSFYAQKGYTKSILKSQEELARALGIKTPLVIPSITISEFEARWSGRELNKWRQRRCRPLIGVHCSASKISKKWPAENFGKVVVEVMKNYPSIGVISFGDKNDRADAERAHQIANGIPWIEGTGKWSIRESLAMLNKCDLVISGDTGIMHMAAAVGSKTLSVFGSTSAERLAPTYNSGRIISPEKVCYPCYRDKFISNCSCIREITHRRVSDETCAMLSDMQIQFPPYRKRRP